MIGLDSGFYTYGASPSELLKKLFCSDTDSYKKEETDPLSEPKDGFLSEHDQKKSQLFQFITRVVGHVFKRSALNSEKVGCAGFLPITRRELVLIYQGLITTDLINVVSRALSSFSMHPQASDYIFNHVEKSVIWHNCDLRIIASTPAGVSPLGSPRKWSEVLDQRRAVEQAPSKLSAGFSLEKPSPTALVSQASVARDVGHKKVALDRLKAHLDDFLNRKMALVSFDDEWKYTFTTHEVLFCLSFVHAKMFSEFNSRGVSSLGQIQAGLYGSSLRACLGLTNTFHDIDLYLKLPLPVDDSFFEHVEMFLKAFFQYKAEINGIRFDLSTVFHRSRVVLSSFNMDVFYLGYGAGLNITYFTPLKGADACDFSLSNFVCEIEDLFVPFAPDFQTLESELKTLSGAPLDPVLDRLSQRIFVVPPTCTHNAFERLLGYVLNGWLPCHGDFKTILEHYFIDDSFAEERFAFLAKSLRKRFQIYSGVMNPEQEESFWMAHLNVYFLAQQLGDSALGAKLKELIINELTLKNPWSEKARALKLLIVTLVHSKIREAGLVLLQAALLPFSRTHALSQMASFHIGESAFYLPISIPGLALWNRSIEACLTYFTSCEPSECTRFLDAWKGFFAEISFLEGNSLLEEEAGLSLPENWAKGFEAPHTLALWKELTLRLLPLLRQQSVAKLCLSLIKGPSSDMAVLLYEDIKVFYSKTETSLCLEHGFESPSAAALSALKSDIHPLIDFFETTHLDWLDRDSLGWVLRHPEFCLPSFLSLLVTKYLHHPDKFSLIRSAFKEELGFDHPLFLLIAKLSLTRAIADSRSDLLFRDDACSRIDRGDFFRITQERVNSCISFWLQAVEDNDFKWLQVANGTEFLDWIRTPDSLFLNVEKPLKVFLNAKNLNQISLNSICTRLSYLCFSQKNRQRLVVEDVFGEQSQELALLCVEKMLQMKCSSDCLSDSHLFLNEIKTFLRSCDNEFLFRLISVLQESLSQNMAKVLCYDVIGLLFKSRLSVDDCKNLMDVFVFLKTRSVFEAGFDGVFNDQIPLILERVDPGFLALNTPLSLRHKESKDKPLWVALKENFGHKVFLQYVLGRLRRFKLIGSLVAEIKESTSLVLYSIETAKKEGLLEEKEFAQMKSLVPKIHVSYSAAAKLRKDF